MVFLAGPAMKSLAETRAEVCLGEYRQGVEDLRPILLEAVRPGDAIMIKSSNGIGFSRLVDALIGQFPAQAGGAAEH